MPIVPTSASDARWDVVGLGANAVDFVYRLPAVPQATGNFSKMRISRETISCGGQMTTALVACARFGLRAKYIGATGTDDNGRRIRRELAHHSVDCSDAIIKDARNQYAVIMVDEVSGERIVLWDRDEKLQLRAHEIPERAIVSARLLHVDDVDQEAAIIAARAPDVAEATAAAVARAVSAIRARPLAKPPGISESVEWANAATVLEKGGSPWPEAFRRAIGVLIKDEEDLALMRGELPRILEEVLA